MKKIIILLLCLVVFSCNSSNDNNEEINYLTSVEKIKEKIVGIWETTNETIYYYQYNAEGIRCGSPSKENFIIDCGRYDIVKKDDFYFLRKYDIGDLVNPDNYVDNLIKRLNDKEIICINSKNEEYTYTRVK